MATISVGMRFQGATSKHSTFPKLGWSSSRPDSNLENRTSTSVSELEHLHRSGAQLRKHQCAESHLRAHERVLNPSIA